MQGVNPQANAGITFDGGLRNKLTHTVTIGILLGLIVGKQIGVTPFAWLAVKLGRAQLPRGVTWPMLYGLSWLGGIGFTMSLFITNLAYGRGSVNLDDAKVGILLASAIAEIGGCLVVWWTLPPTPPELDGDKSADPEQ